MRIASSECDVLRHRSVYMQLSASQAAFNCAQRVQRRSYSAAEKCEDDNYRQRAAIDANSLMTACSLMSTRALASIKTVIDDHSLTHFGDDCKFFDEHSGGRFPSVVCIVTCEEQTQTANTTENV